VRGTILAPNYRFVTSMNMKH